MATPATADDVLAAVKRFADGSALAALLVGGWHHERPKAGAVMPWAVAKIETGEPIRYYAGSLVTFKLTVEIRSQEGLHDRKSIALALSGLDWWKFLTLPGTDARVLHCRPVPNVVKTEPEQHQARDVALTVGVWEVLVQQPRVTRNFAIGWDSSAIGSGTTAIGAGA